MKFKATFAVVAALTIAGYAYAATKQISDAQEVAELKQTITALKDRVTRLEDRVNDMSTAKVRLINEHTHQHNQR